MSGIDTRRMWKPTSNLPWKAVTKGTDSYIWWEIQDSGGWEVCSFGGVIRDSEEHDQSVREICMILTAVNGTDVIEFDGNEIRVEWR